MVQHRNPDSLLSFLPLLKASEFCSCHCPHSPPLFDTGLYGAWAGQLLKSFPKICPLILFRQLCISAPVPQELPYNPVVASSPSAHIFPEDKNPTMNPLWKPIPAVCNPEQCGANAHFWLLLMFTWSFLTSNLVWNGQ